MKKLLLLMFVPGVVFAMGKKPLMEANLLKAQAEEMNAFKSEVKGDIKGLESNIEKMENDLKANGSAIAGFNNQIKQVNETVSTSAGRDITTTNDAKMIVDLNNKVLDTYKDLTQKYIFLLQCIIGTLFASTASGLASLIALVVWVIKFLLKRSQDAEEFMQNQINKEANK